jgi:hypothetical protein
LSRALVAIAVIAISASARADDRDGFLHTLAGDVRARLDALAAARAPKPPVPIAVKWRPQRLGSLDLGAPLAALAAADLDGDGKAELYAVTSRDVIAIAADKRAREVGRVAFTGEPAVPQSREPVGSAIAVHGELIASVSSWARGMRVTWKNKQLVGDVAEPGFELCAGERAQIAPGRNYFGEGGSALFAVRCADLVDAHGLPLHVRAQLSATTGKLDVVVQRCAADGSACSEIVRRDYPNIGVAFELADVDRDGTPDLIYSGAVAPGEKDSVKALAIGDDEKKAKLRKPASAEGVVGIAIGDVDGDGAPDVIVAVRLFGANRLDKIELWRLN